MLLFPKTVSGQYRLFGTEAFKIGWLELGFGTDYLWELQKSLTISSSSGTVTVHDLEDGTTVTEPLGSDPRLLNRKFDIEWEMDGPGVLIPVSGSFGTGWGRVQTSFSFQAREGDFDLRFLNQREQEPDDSLHGRGTFYGAELSVATLCRRCPWFTESGFRFQKLSGANAERSQSFASPGLRVMGDESRLSRETRDAFARFGYSFSGKDIVTYTGVRHRRADVEVEDELRLLDPQFNQETAMRSRTKLDGSATEAIVGAEARRGSYIGRTEITFNNEDYGVFATVTYFPSAQHEKFDFAKFAALVAPQLAQLEAEFRERRERLTVVSVNNGGRAYLAAEIKHLLDWTESRLFKIFHPREFAPLRDSIRWRFKRFRKMLGLIEPAIAKGGQVYNAESGIALAALRTYRNESSETLWFETKADPILNDTEILLHDLSERTKIGNGLTLNLCVVSTPVAGAKFRMKSEGREVVKSGGTTLEIRDVAVGRYLFKIEYEVEALRTRFPAPIQCGWDSGGNDKECLELSQTQGDQLLRCDFLAGSCTSSNLPPNGCPTRGSSVK